MINWADISTVLLDMDGTLLDLHYDNHFWREHVPTRYAEKNGLDSAVARELLSSRFKREEGKLEWYCVDYWSRELELDIALLKREIGHLIAVRPHVLEFLGGLRTPQRRVMLVTNAHGKSLDLKLGRTQLGGYFDAIVSAHDIGVPKEHPDFWPRMQMRQPFDKQRALFVDDSLSVLRAAKQYGIAHILAISNPDSRAPHKDVGEFSALTDFRDIMP